MNNKNNFFIPILIAIFFTLQCATTNIVYPDGRQYNLKEDDYSKKNKKRVGSSRDDRNDESNKEKYDEDDLYGIASWYGYDFDGKRTASGEVFNSRKLTAAHRTLPLGTVVSVRNLENDKEVVVRINDRGPYIQGRVLDLSERGAEVLDYKIKGLTQVSITVLEEGKRKKIKKKLYGATYDYYGKGGYEGKHFTLTDAWRKEGLLDSQSVPRERKTKKFRIQIGSYSDLANARFIEHSTREKFDLPVALERKGKNYVVKLGSFVSRSSAEVFLSGLQQKGYAAIIVR